jgi:anti-anti-sigma regulatory factor
MSRQLELSVEHPAERVSVVYATGVLDRLTTPRLARLLDAQLNWCLARSRESGDQPAHLVIDLDGVGVFGSGGLSVLRHAHHTAREAGVGLALTGLSARAGLLPGWAGAAVSAFDGFSTVQAAVEALTRSDPQPQAVHPEVAAPGPGVARCMPAPSRRAPAFLPRPRG